MKIRKKRLILLNRWANLSIQASPRRPMLSRKWYCSLSSHNVLLVSFLFLETCVWIPFSENPIFLIYSSLLHILTSHLYLTNLSSWHLSLFTSEEGGRRSLFSSNLHYSGHFLINTTDKAIAYHLMWGQQATPNWKLPIFSLILSLQTILPT